MQVLMELVSRRGELVTRQELINRFWGNSSLADTEVGLNIAVKKLRDGLRDSAHKPRLIETLARRGYRPLVTVDTGVRAGVQSPVDLLERATSIRSVCHCWERAILVVNPL